MGGARIRGASVPITSLKGLSSRSPMTSVLPNLVVTFVSSSYLTSQQSCSLSSAFLPIPSLFYSIFLADPSFSTSNVRAPRSGPGLFSSPSKLSLWVISSLNILYIRKASKYKSPVPTSLHSSETSYKRSACADIS